MQRKCQPSTIKAFARLVICRLSNILHPVCVQDRLDEPEATFMRGAPALGLLLAIRACTAVRPLGHWIGALRAASSR